MARDQPLQDSAVQRWDVHSLVRSRRGFDERVQLAAPALPRALSSLAIRARAGSSVRRLLLGRAICVGFAANNRGDYAALTALLSPDIELHVYPDAPEMRASDLEPVYHGHEGYVKAAKLLKAGFVGFHWEVQELIDPGGDRFGARVDQVGRSSLSSAELRMREFHVWQIQNGLARRQWSLTTEAAMLGLLLEARASC
jgi:ketosteroid isomerase-like protein